MESAFNLMLWRAALAHAPVVPGASELVDWALLLYESGEMEAAALLHDVAAIRQGFSFELCELRKRLYGDAPRAEAAAAPRAGPWWTIDLGIAELSALAEAFSPTLIFAPRPRVSSHPDNAAGIGPVNPPSSGPGDIAADARRLRAILADPVTPDEVVAAEATRLLDQFVEADRRLPSFDYRGLRDAPLDRLTVGIALAALMDFALETRDLATAPTGSIGLLHCTARLGQFGLGPYLSGVGGLLRESRDLFELAGLVAATGSEAHEAWIFLLARGCMGPLRFEIIDDLGDRCRADLLAALLGREISRTAACVDQAIVRRIRDAALDNADWSLATAAQRAIVRLQPASVMEGRILGNILATDGDFAGAEAVYRAMVIAHADDAELRAAAHRLRGNDASGLTIVHGFASPPDRLEHRLRRRGLASSHQPRRGERISAVDVS